MTYIPLFFDVQDRKVLVIGGGKVGTRRALFFYNGGAKVTVISLEFSDELKRIDEIKKISTDIRSNEGNRILEEILEKNDIIVIATSDENVNNYVYEKAIKKGKLVNNATNASKGNIIVPFIREVHGLKIAVTSLGKTGIAARYAIERIYEFLKQANDIKDLYIVMERLKRYMKATIRDPKKRYKLYFDIEKDPEFMKFIQSGYVEKAFERGKEIIDSSLKT